MDFLKEHEIAILIAREAHAGQKRKDGSDYFGHVLRVATNFPVGSIEYTVGLLHDVFEDCPGWTMQVLRQRGVSPTAIQLVDILTHKPAISYLDYIIFIKEDDTSRRIKLADIADNLNGATGTLRDKYLMAKYILEH